MYSYHSVSLEKKIRSGIIYRYMCSNCNLLTTEKPCPTFKSEQLNTWGSPILQEHTLKTFVLSDHLLQCNCTKNFDDFNILTIGSNKFKLLLRESLLIKRDKLILNMAIKSFHLELFD